MKSLLAAVNLLTVAFGNLIVVIVSEVRFFENQVCNNIIITYIYYIMLNFNINIIIFTFFLDL